MPIYLYRCRNKKCKHEQEAIRRIAKVYDPIYCNKCGHQMENVIAKPSRFVRGAGSWTSPAGGS